MDMIDNERKQTGPRPSSPTPRPSSAGSSAATPASASRPPVRRVMRPGERPNNSQRPPERSGMRPNDRPMAPRTNDRPNVRPSAPRTNDRPSDRSGDRSGSEYTFGARSLRPRSKRVMQETPSREVAPRIAPPTGAPRLRVIPLGGLEEVGRNMTVIEYGNDILIVDMGFMFPDETMPGIDYVLPDTSYLQQNRDRIKGVIITHGHLDHTGAIPYIIKNLGMPTIYGTKLTIGLIRDRLEEFNLDKQVRMAEVHPDDVLQLGIFKASFFRVNHNIPDSVGTAIKTPIGTLVFTGDWKFDHTPIDGQTTEFGKLALLGREGVLLLCSDSTNTERTGYSPSERDIQATLEGIFEKVKGRIIISTFASLLSRIQQVINIAAKLDRKVAISGLSMEKTLTVAAKLGYLKVPRGTLIKLDQAHHYPDSRVVIISTGSQGQENSSLGRMSRGEHRHIKLQPSDTVILSSSPIPGNEAAVARLMNNIYSLGSDVIYNKLFDVHASGHAYREEHKLMLGLLRPKYLMPYHGERSMLEQHVRIAWTMGWDKTNTFVMANGEALEIDERSARVGKTKYVTDDVLVDGLGVGDVSNVVLRDRQALAQDGMLVVVGAVDKDGKLVMPPDVISRGFVFVKEADQMMADVRALVTKIINTYPQEDIGNWAPVRTKIRDDVGQFLFKKIERRPMILPVIIKI